MKPIQTVPFTSATLIAFLVLAAYATAVAQRVPRSSATAHPRPAHTVRADSRPTAATRAEAREERSFRGISSKLGMTPGALEDAFEAARQTNPKLSRDHFIEANVLAQNLGSTDPKITTHAILDGLKNGKRIDQTLESLGLSESEAKGAEHAADREVKEADQQAKEAEKAAEAEARRVRSFKDIAPKLGTTPGALEDAFEAARQANPKLGRDHFIEADVLAQNLGSKHPKVTIQAILDGLKSGKSIDQTLESLGLSDSEAKAAEQAADREIKGA